MASSSLRLPVIQNWGCHNCGGCCREHLIEINEEEKRRIEKQGWKQSDGIPMDRPVIQQTGPGRYRLSHKADGSCVFLDDDGLCRIHARFGEPAKPLACQVYPYAFHPRGNRLTTSLRFSCPSVVQNLGPPLTEQQSELETLCRSVVAGRKTETDPPEIHGLQEVPWSDVNRFVDALDGSLQDRSVNFTVRLLRTVEWMKLVEQSQFETIRGTKLQEFLDLISGAAQKAQPDNDLPQQTPSGLGRMMFRQLAMQMARHDTDALARGGWKVRWQLLRTALRVAAGRGEVPEINQPASVVAAFGPLPENRVSFARLEQPAGGRRADIDDLFERYFRVKLQGMHFCGPACWQLSVADGFRALTLMYPITLWLARWRAARRGEPQLDLVDVQAALATADHNFGYSPVLGTSAATNRNRQLAKLEQISALCEWYSR